MNRKNILLFIGSFTCVFLLGYFSYSTAFALIKSKAVSQEVNISKNISSENSSKNSQDDLSKKIKDPEDKKENSKNETYDKNNEKASKNSNDKSSSDKASKSNSNIKEDKKEDSNKNTNSKEKSNSEKKNNLENSKSESKSTISYSSYLKNLETEKYTLKEDEDLNSIAKKFSDTCTLNSSLNIIKSLNKINSTSSLDAGDTLLVPVNAFQDGKKFSVKEGDTWYSIARKNYPKYNHEAVINFLMNINSFKDNILPLGEDIFLPNI